MVKFQTVEEEEIVIKEKPKKQVKKPSKKPKIETISKGEIELRRLNFCSNCGYHLKSKSKYVCPNCGYQLIITGDKKKNKKEIISWFIKMLKENGEVYNLDWLRGQKQNFEEKAYDM